MVKRQVIAVLFSVCIVGMTYCRARQYVNEVTCLLRKPEELKSIDIHGSSMTPSAKYHCDSPSTSITLSRHSWVAPFRISDIEVSTSGFSSSCNIACINLGLHSGCASFPVFVASRDVNPWWLNDIAPSSELHFRVRPAGFDIVSVLPSRHSAQIGVSSAASIFEESGAIIHCFNASPATLSIDNARIVIDGRGTWMVSLVGNYATPRTIFIDPLSIASLTFGDSDNVEFEIHDVRRGIALIAIPAVATTVKWYSHRGETLTMSGFKSAASDSDPLSQFVICVTTSAP